jgi:uncharacterized membrane protein YccC
MQAEVTSLLWPHVVKALIGLALTGLGALLMYPIRAIKKEWANLNKKIEAAQEELVHQRTNCLSTLQAQGEKQVTALDKIADTLSLMHLDQKETLGMLRKH